MQTQLMILFMLSLPCTIVSAAPPSAKRHAVQVAGTYSTLEFHDEGGDLLGIEVKIVPIAEDSYHGMSEERS
jgi:hypothetical protein